MGHAPPPFAPKPLHPPANPFHSRKPPPPPALTSLLDGDPVERDLAYCREMYAYDRITLAEHARRVELILSGRREEAIPERNADDDGLEPIETEGLWG